MNTARNASSTSSTVPYPDGCCFIDKQCEHTGLLAGSMAMAPKVDQYGFVVASNQSLHPETSGDRTNGELRSSNPSEEYGARNRIREMKWIDMFNRWDFFIEKNQRKLRDRCRKGIPQSCRGRAWLKLTSAFKLQQHRKHVYPILLSRTLDPKLADEIKRDLHRTLPQHSMFTSSSGIGQKKLFEVLKCYALYNPKVGYCQVLSPITAVLLLYMDCEEAFWVLVRISDVYLVEYFDEGMRGIQIDSLIFRELCKKFLPKHYAILSKCQIDFVVLVQKWFFCIFSRTLPWNITLRVWDSFFFEGKWCLFRVGLTLLKYSLIEIVQHPSSVDEFTVLNTIHKFNVERLDEEKFLVKSLDYKVTSEAKKKLNELCAKRYDKKRMESSNALKAQEGNQGFFNKIGRYVFQRNKDNVEDEAVGVTPTPKEEKSKERRESGTEKRAKNKHLGVGAPPTQDALSDVLKSERNGTDIHENGEDDQTTCNITPSLEAETYGTVEPTEENERSAVEKHFGNPVGANGPDVLDRYARQRTSLNSAAAKALKKEPISAQDSSPSAVIIDNTPSPRERDKNATNKNLDKLPEIEN